MTERDRSREPVPAAEATGPAAAASSRRRFLWKIWLGLGAVALLELIWLVLDFLRPGKARPEELLAAILVAGPVDRFEPGSVTAFPRGKFYLARLEDGGFLALSRECTHLGCTVPWVEEEGRFVCPCHASAFSLRGEVLSPPAPRPLDLYAVRIENGIVKVDVSRTMKRQAFEAAQAVRS
jgi:cytochrome b6-f complex iron-sulfur subunit